MNMTQLPPAIEMTTAGKGLLTLATPMLVDYLYVCKQLRQDEREQFVALSDGRPYDAERMALYLATRAGPRWALVDPEGSPVVLGGYEMLREGVWQDWLIGTPEGWQKYWRSITKHCRQVVEHMLASEAHRVQTLALASRTQAHAWYRTLGLQYEATLAAYGVHGEDCVMYARLASQMPHTTQEAA